MMALIREAWALASIAYYDAAMRHVGGAHVDVPYMVRRRRELEDELASMRGFGVTQK